MHKIGATGVYIGRLEQTKKEVKDGDNDAAHVDDAGQHVIRYINASKDHAFLIGKFLKMDEGVTPDVFKASEASSQENPDEKKENKEPSPEDKKEETKTEQKPVAIEIKNVVYKSEVTGEPRMKYFKVPRLGCYLAVPLVYASCLFSEALDSAVADYAAYQEKVKKNKELMKEYEDKLAEAKAEQQNESVDKSVEPSKEKKAETSKAAEGGEPVPEEPKLEPPKLEEVKEPEYKTKPMSYVVCLDTLGQDRELTQEQKTLVIETVAKYRQNWEDRERLRLTNDRKIKEEEKQKEAEFAEKLLPTIQEEEDKFVEEKVTALPEEMAEEEKKVRERIFRWEHKVRQIAVGQLKERAQVLQRYNVIKLPRIMQSLFYLLGFTRDEICEPGTNKLFWKKARNFWNEALFEKFMAYTPIGPKEGHYKKYQTINFLEKNLDGITEEEVHNYSLGLEKVFHCLQNALELRKENILKRRANRERLTKERDEIIQKNDQRTKDRAEELRVKKEEALNVFILL